MGFRLDKELNELAAVGITVADLTSDEIEELVRACDRCANPYSDVNADLAGRPIRVTDKVAFWKPTIGACVWLDEYARMWWDERPTAYKWALVYALIHGRDPEAFVDLTDEKTAYERIRKTAMTLCVSKAEIDHGLDVALDIHRKEFDGRSPNVGSSADWSHLVRRLETQTGIPASEWLWNRSADYAVRAYHDLRYFAKTVGGSKCQRMKDELDYALKKLAKVRKGIVYRVKAERKAKEAAS